VRHGPGWPPVRLKNRPALLNLSFTDGGYGARDGGVIPAVGGGASALVDGHDVPIDGRGRGRGSAPVPGSGQPRPTGCDSVPRSDRSGGVDAGRVLGRASIEEGSLT